MSQRLERLLRTAGSRLRRRCSDRCSGAISASVFAAWIRSPTAHRSQHADRRINGVLDAGRGRHRAPSSPGRRARRGCRRTYPGASARTASVAARSAGARESSTTRGSPPCCSTIGGTSPARPDVERLRTCSRASSGVSARPPSRTMRRQLHRQIVQVVGPRPLQRLDATRRTSRALPTARPSGTSIAVISASVRTPLALPTPTIDSASARASVARLHERPAAALHVHDQARRCPRRSSCSGSTR